MEAITFTWVCLDAAGRVTDRRRGTGQQRRQPLPDGPDLELLLLPGGRFEMGSSPGQGFPDEHPRHPVDVAPFLLGRSPVTQAEWAAVMDEAPPFRHRGDDLPVDRIALADAQAFVARLTELTGRSFRLPSEAEWEYVARAGTTGDFSCGPTLTTDVANYVGLHRFLHEPEGTYRHHSTPAGTFPANPFGLFDMHGNVWEWCADTWHDDYVGAPITGTPWTADGEPGYGVLRGGSWHDPPHNCRSATRLRFDVADWEDFVGLRVAAVADPPRCSP